MKYSHDIDDVHAHAEDHVHDAENDGQLHLERVLKYNLVAGEHPNRVQAHGIRMPYEVTTPASCTRVQLELWVCVHCGLVVRDRPTRSEYVN